MDGDKSTYLKRVFNGGDSTAFVKVNILEILYDADGKSREVPLKSSADGAARDGLMASPARLIVPANGMQGTRLLYMGERDRERYFRVRFVPVVPEKEDEFAVSGEEREEYRKDPVRRGHGAGRLWRGVFRPSQGHAFRQRDRERRDGLPYPQQRQHRGGDR